MKWTNLARSIQRYNLYVLSPYNLLVYISGQSRESKNSTKIARLIFWDRGSVNQVTMLWLQSFKTDFDVQVVIETCKTPPLKSLRPNWERSWANELHNFLSAGHPTQLVTFDKWLLLTALKILWASTTSPQPPTKSCKFLAPSPSARAICGSNPIQGCDA